VDVDLRKPDIRVVVDAIAARDRLLRAELDAAQVLTAPSRTAAEMVRRHMPTERAIEVVPHGVVQHVETRARPRGEGETLRIGTFGNLVAAKGVMELVEACAGLPCELHLHGAFLEPTFEASVRGRAAELGIRLLVHGSYGSADPHPALGLHLAVFPSRCQETYGLVVDEALAHGVPVVVSDQGALAERAGTGGLVVTPLVSLATTLRALACEPGGLDRLRAAVPTALRTMADAARDYLALYGRAAAEVRP
jgi:glycosyltransferase involved in cell wall biosynthesis